MQSSSANIGFKNSDSVLDGMLEHLSAAFSSSNTRKIGIETEFLIYDRQLNTRLHSCNDHRQRVLSERLIAEYGASFKELDGVITRLTSASGKISFEHGGQIEFASNPYSNIDALWKETVSVVATIAQIANELSLALLPIGYDPLSGDSTEYVLRDNSIILNYLRQYEPSLVPWAVNAAAFQLTLDAETPDEAIELALAASILGRLFTGVLCNSPYVSGHSSASTSHRNEILSGRSSSRIGRLIEILGKRATLDDYARLVTTNLPLMWFPDEVGEPTCAYGLTLCELVNERSITSLSEEQLNACLTQLWTDVRLRPNLEIRFLDALPVELSLSVCAVLAGVLYCPESRRQAMHVMAQLPANGVATGDEQWEAFGKIIDLAASGLSQFCDAKDIDRDVLSEVRALWRHRATPGELFAECGGTLGDRFAGNVLEKYAVMPL